MSDRLLHCAERGNKASHLQCALRFCKNRIHTSLSSIRRHYNSCINRSVKHNNKLLSNTSGVAPTLPLLGIHLVAQWHYYDAVGNNVRFVTNQHTLVKESFILLAWCLISSATLSIQLSKFAIVYLS